MGKILSDTKKNWPELGLYERFEQSIAIILTIAVSIIVLIATWRLVLTLFQSIPVVSLETARFDIVREIFAKILVVLIALEFNHTIRGLIERRRGIVQVQAVVLIALLAVLRKLLVVEITPEETGLLLALAALILALGGVYWGLCQQEGKSDRNHAARDAA